MIVSLLVLLAAISPSQAQPVVPSTNYVVSILSEIEGDEFSLRFVLSGPPSTYSSTREGDDIVVRIGAEPLPAMTLPAASGPIRALSLGEGPGFNLRVALGEFREHEIVRESASLRLLLRKRVAAPAPPPAATPTPGLDALAIPTPSPSPTPVRQADPVGADTADLYRRLFPSTSDPSSIGSLGGGADTGSPENWYSDFRWLGLQVRPWVSVSYVDAQTTQVQTNTVPADSYWVIQPNLGLGFSPTFGGAREGQWRINYTPRFRRLLDLNLPRLGSHFFDVGVDQPVASFGAIYGTYHFSKGVLETDEIDPGREYGIGLNRVVDTSLERFRRHSFLLGLRFDFVADTQLDVNVGKTRVRYGNDPGESQFVFGERAFFDYDTRTLNASLRREMGESRMVGLVFGVHDTPTQIERRQVEGRGYSYGVSLDGAIAALTTGRLQVGYRTQKSPNAGAGGRDYKDVTYSAQIAREISDDTSIGIGADRRLYLSAYEDNAFYVADSLRGDVTTRLPFAVYLRGGVAFQTNSYKASPQFEPSTGQFELRRDKLRSWSVGLTRNLFEWAFVRFDYTAERRNSNLDRFDIKTRALTFQLGLGFFGKPGRQGAPSW